MADEYFCLEVIIPTHEASFLEGYANLFLFGADLRKKCPPYAQAPVWWVLFFERFMCSVFAEGCVSLKADFESLKP